MIKVEFNEQELIDIRERIGDIKGAVETVFSRGINSTILATKKESIARVGDELNLPKERLTKAFTVKKANVDNLSGKVICSKIPVGLVSYGAFRVADGVFVAPFRKAGGKTIKHVFIATANKATNVFGRETIYKRPYKPWVEYKKLPRAWRFPLKRFAGPSVYSMFSRASIIEPVTIYAGHILTDRIEKAFYRYALKHPESYSDLFQDDILD